MRKSTRLHLEKLAGAEQAKQELVAVFYADPNTDSECIVKIMQKDKPETIISRHLLRRSETGYVLESNPPHISYVDASLKGTIPSRALQIPMGGSAILHIAAAMIKEGYICLLRGYAGE